MTERKEKPVVFMCVCVCFQVSAESRPYGVVVVVIPMT